MIRVALHTLGCRANQSDTETLESRLLQKGFQIVSFEEFAEAYIINTCTVTHSADREARSLLRQAHRRNPLALILATGCYAQVAPEELLEVKGVRYVIGNDRKDQIAEIIAKAFENSLIPTKETAKSELKRSRAYLKIQDGCNFRCSFCIIPFARGASRSKMIPEVLQEIQKLKEAGYQEIILTGIHIGSYGWDLKPKQTLLDLLITLEKEKPIARIRLSTLDPDEVTKPMIDFLAESKIFCPHLHIAIQSGEDQILKKMRRRHTTKELLEITDYASKKIEDLALGADIITGFPGETHKDHTATKKVLSDLYLTYLHLFPYSERKGTAAATYPDSVPVQKRRERSLELIALGEKKRERFFESQIGKRRSAVFEGFLGDEPQKAITDNFISLRVKNSSAQKGSLREVVIQTIENGKVFGICL